MTASLSLDLRSRVLAAVASGLSHRQAGERFGVSAASVSRWRALERETGTARARARGGDQRSRTIEAHAALILRLSEAARDATLDELRSALVQHGVVIGYGGLWRFFRRHNITLKKRRHMRPNRAAPTSFGSGKTGSMGNSALIPIG